MQGLYSERERTTDSDMNCYTDDMTTTIRTVDWTVYTQGFDNDGHKPRPPKK